MQWLEAKVAHLTETVSDTTTSLIHFQKSLLHLLHHLHNHLSEDEDEEDEGGEEDEMLKNYLF